MHKSPIRWQAIFEALEALSGRGQGPSVQVSPLLLEVLEESRERVRRQAAGTNGHAS